MPDQRRCELGDGSSSKFWTVVVDGKSHTVRYGRIGTSGQTKTKTFESTESATAAAEKLIAQKMKKGYKSAVVPLLSDSVREKMKRYARVTQVAKTKRGAGYEFCFPSVMGSEPEVVIALNRRLLSTRET